jgi:putative transposase
MCRVLRVSPSGFYAWRRRGPSARAQRDAAVLQQLRVFHQRSDGTYGAPRLWKDLREEADLFVGQKRVARLLRAAGLVRGQPPVRRPHHPSGRRRDTRRRSGAAPVHRDGPNQLWVADITYVPTWAGFLFLATVLNVFSRRIVGWAMATHLRTELVLQALQMAVTQRRPRQVIPHSDRGCQYTALAFGQRCQEMGVRPSRGAVGSAYDNAMAESFFATLECELLDRRCFRTQAEARMAIFRYIEGWYNPHRRHSSLGQQSPINFERLMSNAA